jgi:hypothetical protein
MEEEQEFNQGIILKCKERTVGTVCGQLTHSYSEKKEEFVRKLGFCLLFQRTGYEILVQF